MRKINWFDRSEWLADLSLKVGTHVLVAGREYVYSRETAKSGMTEHILSPVDIGGIAQKDSASVS